MLREMRFCKCADIFHIDTAVRWRPTNDNRLILRIIGGIRQAIHDSIKVFQCIKKNKPDIIHLCSSGSLSTIKDMFILAVGKKIRLKSIIHYRTGKLESIFLSNGFENRLTQHAIELSDCVLVLDKLAEESIRRLLPRKCVKRIPNFIDIDIISKLKSKRNDKRTDGSQMQIVYSGWVIPTKGLRELVRACLRIENISFELNIVGSVLDEFKLELESIAIKREKGNWLKFYGQVEWEESITAIASADIFVLPSYTEGFPNVILEAMALGKPIVATKVGAIPEMLGDDTDEPCGLLVNPQDVEGLHASLIDLMEKPAKASVLGERAEKRASALYESAIVMPQYVDLWRSLISGSSKLK